MPKYPDLASHETLIPSPLNPRKAFPPTELEEMAATIRLHGIIEPLVVRPVAAAPKTKAAAPAIAWEIICGEKRWRAAKLAGFMNIPIVVRCYSDAQALVVMAIENQERSDVLPSEKAAHLKRMIDAGGTLDQVAKSLGRSVSTLRSVLALNQAPPLLREALDRGQVPMATAGLVCRIPDAGLRETAAVHVLGGWNYWRDEKDVKRWKPAAEPEEPLSYRGARSLIQRHCMRELKGAPFDRQSLDLVPSAGACAACPKLAANRQKLDAGDCEGLRGDTCTDPACYLAKVRATAALKEEEAAAAGRKVLAAAEAKKIWDYDGERVAAGAAYVDLDATDYSDHRQRSYRQLLKAELGNGLADKIAVAVDEKGRAHELLPRAAVMAALKRDRGTEGGRDGGKEVPAELRQQALASKINVEVEKTIVDGLLFQAAGGLAKLDGSHKKLKALLQMLIAEEVNSASEATVRTIAASLGLPTGAAILELEKSIVEAAGRPAGSDGERLALFARLRLWNGFLLNADENQAILAETFTIRREGLEKEVRAKFEREAAAAAMPKNPQSRNTSIDALGGLSTAQTERLKREKIGTIGALADALADGRDVGLGAKQETIRGLVEDFLAAAKKR